MRALKCDICGKFFDPEENAAKHIREGDDTVDRLAFLHSNEGGHEVIRVVDVCYECVASMLEAVNYRIVLPAMPNKKQEEKNGNQV